MTLHVYNCETVTIRSERVKRIKDETFYGLRLHMNTDQAITFWSKTEEGLQTLVDSLAATLKHTAPIPTCSAPPGQMNRN